MSQSDNNPTDQAQTESDLQREIQKLADQQAEIARATGADWTPAERVAPEAIIRPTYDYPSREDVPRIPEGRYARAFGIDHKDPEANRIRTLCGKRSGWAHFCRWMDREGYASLADLGETFPSQFKTYLQGLGTLEKSSIRPYMMNGRHIVNWCTAQGYINPAHPRKNGDGDDGWNIPKNPTHEARRDDDEVLSPDDGERVLRWLENNALGSAEHLCFSLAFCNLFRESAVRNIDESAVYLNPPGDRDPYVYLEDRPYLGDDDDEGLKLKGSKQTGYGKRDRFAPLHPYVLDVIRLYRATERETPTPPYRYPEADPGLITTSRTDRIAGSTIRRYVNWATYQALAGPDCDCSYCAKNGPITKLDDACKCEHSRAPHPVRHGGVTYMKNSDEDYSWDLLSEMAGTSIEVLKSWYDHGTKGDRLDRVSGELWGGEE